MAGDQKHSNTLSETQRSKKNSTKKKQQQITVS